MAINWWNIIKNVGILCTSLTYVRELQIAEAKEALGLSLSGHEIELLIAQAKAQFLEVNKEKEQLKEKEEQASNRLFKLLVMREMPYVTGVTLGRCLNTKHNAKAEGEKGRAA